MLLGVLFPLAANAEQRRFDAARVPRTWYSTYRVEEIGRAGMPRLTERQRRWLHRVATWPAVVKRHPMLRFALPVGDVHVPLIVFDARTAIGWEVGAPLAIPAIGDYCSVLYSPELNELRPTTGADCNPIYDPHYQIPGSMPFRPAWMKT